MVPSLLLQFDIYMTARVTYGAWDLLTVEGYVQQGEATVDNKIVATVWARLIGLAGAWPLCD